MSPSTRQVKSETGQIPSTEIGRSANREVL